MRDPKQKMRYSSEELSLIKNTFSGDDACLYAVRKHMLGAELTDGEKEIIKKLSPETKKLLRKCFMPSIDADSPFFVLSDMALGLKTELDGKSREEGMDIIEVKRLEIEYTKQRLDELDGIFAENPITLHDLADLNHPEVFTRIKARNFLLGQIDTLCVYDLRLLANKKDEETVQQAAERMAKDSLK